MKHSAKSIMKNFEDDYIVGLSFLVDVGNQQIPVRLPVKIEECLEILKIEKKNGMKNIKATREQAERSCMAYPERLDRSANGTFGY